MMPSPVDARAGDSFIDVLTPYSARLLELLSDVRWAVWRPRFWNAGRLARTDPELRKVLQRLHGFTDALVRLYRVDAADPSGDDWSGLTRATRQRVRELLATDPSDLRLDSALEVSAALGLLLTEVGDARYICAEVQNELVISQEDTTWLTWRQVYGDGRPPILDSCHGGNTPPQDHVDAARQLLLGLHRARIENYQFRRARLRMRARALSLMSVMLLPVVAGFGGLTVSAGDLPTVDVALVAVAGALGALVAGTIKARDRIVRTSDVRAFASGIVAQVLLGAGSALLLLVVLLSGMVDIAGADDWAGRAVVGFAAGFSEPLVIGTIERVAMLGDRGPRLG